VSGKGVFQQLVESQQSANRQQFRQQRIVDIKRIQEIRKRPLVVYVTSLNVPPRVTNYISHEDIVPFGEVLESVEGDAVDVLLESPGGLSEVAQELSALLRHRFKRVGFIIPHAAMSAATMLVMSGDEILMDHRSSLGPIDPQFVGNDGRPQPAQAILSGIKTIKKLVDEEDGGHLHPVYIPILRNIDPGKYQMALHATELSKRIVRDWLVEHKLAKWTTHKKSGRPVTVEERESLAEKVADELCTHGKWLSHTRPIKIHDLERMELEITDYGKHQELQQAIWSLWVRCHHLLSSTNTYKMYESECVDFHKLAVPVALQAGGLPLPVPPGQRGGLQVQHGHAVVEVQCVNCKSAYKVQANFGAPQPMEPGAEPFPKDSMLTCKKCGAILDLTGLKMQLEAQVRQPLVLEANT